MVGLGSSATFSQAARSEEAAALRDVMKALLDRGATVFDTASALDFIGIDSAVDNRRVETTILPLARERKIGVLVYAPFGRTRLFRRVGDRPLPDWASEFDARSWAQFFLKFVLAHPAVNGRDAGDQPGAARARHPRRGCRAVARRRDAQAHRE